jgi:Zn-dependent protease with chaperone function
MAIDFFHHQDVARHTTTRLLIYFALAVLSLVVLVYLLCVVIFVEAAHDARTAPPFWEPELFLWVLIGVGAVVAGGSLIKTAELSAGGKTVALMLGGQHVPGNTTDPRQRRLLNVVEEMALASGMPVPAVYVLPNENGINAFAAGHGAGDAVVTVSEGCLDYLKRDELQGVVAHEFSHILNGDMRLNIRLLGLIYGILALSLIGRILLDVGARGRSSSKDEGRGALLALGLGLYLLGLAGAFFGWLIQAAVSRQREYLADASAVQFTRNPDGIGGALKKIGGLKDHANIASARAEEVSHMFFADALRGRRFTNWFATHPPLQDRIKRIDPMFDGVYPTVSRVDVSAAELKAPRPARLPPIIPGMPAAPVLALAPNSAAMQVGHVTPREVAHARDLRASISDTLRSAAREPFSARALVYCLLLDARPPIRSAQLAHLQAEAEPRDYQETLRLEPIVGALPDASRLPLVDLTIPALRHMSPGQHQAFRTQVERLIYADQQVSIFEYALRSVLHRYLDADFRKARVPMRRQAPRKLVPALVKVLSLLAWEGQPEEEKARTAFAAGMASYLDGAPSAYALAPRAECSLAEFDAALHELARTMPGLRRRVLVACAACILADRQVTTREAELLRAISATLGCPMPPLLPDTQEKEYTSRGQE